MDECLLRCRQRGVSTIDLHTAEAMDVAWGMYERMGFLRRPENNMAAGSRMVVMAYSLDWFWNLEGFICREACRVALLKQGTSSCHICS